MKTLYLDCGMGASGDMLAAALLQLHPEPDRILSKLGELGLPGVNVHLEAAEKCGITGAHFSVCFHGHEEDDCQHGGHEHHHGHSLSEIESMLENLTLPEAVRTDAKAVYRLLAEAEGAVHGRAPDNIHFHEVGTFDAITDILAVCLLMNELAPDSVRASAVHVGSGCVKCAHGILPVPAPATAKLLTGIPTYSTEISGELCTPTGAALLRRFVSRYGPMPEMTAEAVGYGMGSRDFPRANCLRAILGESADAEVAELRCNVDDMSCEAVGFALETLMTQGALDACWQPIGMKKSRPGMLLTVLCMVEDKARMTELLFKHTTTIGIREYLCGRYILRRDTERMETPYGPVSIKTSEGCGTRRRKAEYDDLSRIASENGLSLIDVEKLLEL